ncbi:MAG: ATP-grasp domain-containing protein [Gammaproteobacteria bacterium]
MKILLFEYVTGGGFNRSDLPAALAREGLLMLRALLDGLAELPTVQLTVMLDARLQGALKQACIETVIVEEQDDCLERFQQLAEYHDAVWPVAPEFEGILHELSEVVENLRKTLLAPASGAVRLAADKYQTFLHLVRHQIPTVPTRLFKECRAFPGECIVKPIDGVGGDGSYLMMDPDDFERVSDSLQDAGRYIIQPHLQGEKTSLSCLFKNGQGWLLSVNLQKFRIVENQYRLSEIWVNHQPDPGRYQALVVRIAEAIPGLWGYAGIDLIETPDRLLVLEINPRLTTSFAGLNAALGLNPGALVLELIHGDPVIRRSDDRTVAVSIDKEGNE